VCVCVCVRARARVCLFVREYVCVCAYVCISDTYFLLDHERELD